MADALVAVTDLVVELAAGSAQRIAEPTRA